MSSGAPLRDLPTLLLSLGGVSSRLHWSSFNHFLERLLTEGNGGGSFALQVGGEPTH
jgi:hypothetical protein